MNRARRFCLLGVLVLVAGLDGLPVLSQGGLTISGYQLISEVRVSRTVSEYTYRAALTNNGGPLAGATAAATSVSPNTTMIDGSLTFGPVGSGATILSTDTFSFRHNRTFAFDWASVQWSVTGQAANQPPVANAGADQTVATGSTVTLNGSGSTDADGNALTYAWSFVTRPAGSGATLFNPTSLSPTFVVDLPGSYTVRLIVNDGTVSSAPDTVTISTTNSPPVANAGPDRTAAVGVPVALDGSASADADGNPLTFAWSFVSRPAGSAAIIGSPSSVSPTFVPDVAGSYVVQLVVNDGLVNSASDTMTVSTVNSPPVANAGADQTALTGSTVTLNGSGSTDADGGSLTYAWSFVSRPMGSVAALSNPAAVLPTFTVDVAGTYVVQLIVHDGTVASAPDTMTVSTLNSPPVANAGPDQFTAVGGIAFLNGAGSSDADGDPLTFAWAFTSRPVGSSATLTGALGSNPSFVVDRAGTYVVQLIVHDGMVASAPDTVTITTTNSPPAANAGPDQLGVSVGSTVTLFGGASNDPDGNGLTFAWSFTARPAGSVATLTGAATTAPTFTPDVAGDYVVQLIVNDGLVSSAPDTVLVQAVAVTPEVNVNATDPGASESGPDPGTFTVTRTGLTTQSLQVFYLVAGTAANVLDYSALTGVVTIPAGQISATVTVVPVDDPAFEGDETVSLTLTLDATYIVGVAGTAAVTIADNDVPTVTVAATDAAASETGLDAGAFTVTRTGATTTSLNVQYSVGGTATSGSDYTPLTGSVTIGAGQSSATVTVTPVDDPDFEGDETVSLTLTANAAYSVGTPGTATVTIADNDVASVTVTATDAAASEAGSDPGTFTITRTGSTTTSLNVQYSVGGTATGGSDYMALTGSVTIAAGQTSATVTVTPVNDADFEGDETVALTLTANAAYSVGTPATATVTIADNDVASVTVTATDAAASEAGPDAGTFTVTRTGATTASLSVQYSVGGTATSGVDYTALTGSVTIAAGQASATVTVTPVDDADFEGDETVALTLTANAAYSAGTPGAAAITIADNDVATVTVTATDAAASEAGPDAGTFTVTRTGATTTSLNVQYSVGGTATSGSDYTPLTGSVTIGAGQSSATVTVTPVDDPDFEGDETVSLTLTANAAYSVGTPGTATVTIADNDVASVTVTATDAAASEAGSDPGTFTITRTGATTASLDVQYSAGGSATSGADYAALTGTVTIPAGQASATVTVTPVDDSDFEGDETVSLTLTASAAYSVGTPGAATVTIEDNDVPTVTVVATDAAAAEAGQDPGTFTITRAGATTASLDVQYSVSGSATSGADYAALTGTVTIPAGQASAAVIVTPIDDPDFEGAETVSLTLTTNVAYSVGTPGAATVTIADNDVPTVTVAATDAAAAEAGQDQGTFTITRAGATTASLDVQYSVSGSATSGADYATLTGTVTIPVGQASAAVTVTPVDDPDFESDETVSLTLTTNVAYTVGTPGAATVTIADNDVPTVTVAATDAAASETGPDAGTITITRTGATTAPLDVQYSVGGSATSGSDYAALTGTVTIPVGQLSVTVTVTPVDDPDFEGDETVSLTLTANAEYSVGAAASVTVTIADNDVPVVTVAATDAVASETGPDAGTFTVTRTGATTASLNVQYSVGGTATSGADYAALTGTVTIAAGQSSATVTVTPVDDSSFEGDETVSLTLTASTAYGVGTPGAATVTIADNDVPTVTVVATDAAAAEAGQDPGTFTITRAGATTASLDVQYSVGGSATSGADYAALTGAVTIAAGQSSAMVTVTPVDDADFEGDETVALTLTTNAAYSVGTPGAATVTIADNDVPTVTIAATDAAASETGPDAGTFTVTRTGATTASLNVQYTVGGTATSGSDYAALTGTVTIAAGQASATVTVTPVNDLDFEGDETVGLTLAANAAYSVGSPSTATVTIADNDVPTVTVAATDAAASEAGPDAGTFTVTRTGATTASLNVQYSVGGTATSGADYAALTGTVTIAAGQSSATVTVTPIDDPGFESDETVTLTLTANVAYSVGTPGAATVTITDNDVPTVTVAATDAAASETGPDAGTFTVTRTGVTTASLNVQYSVGGTATSGADYAALTGTVTIPAGQASATVTVTPVNDAGSEGDETVVLTLTANAVYSVGTPAAATVTIADNDAPAVTVVATDATAGEAGPDAGTFTITRTGATTLPLAVQYGVGGTASSADYAALTGTMTIPAGQLSATVTVTPVDDGNIEADETVVLTLSGTLAYSVGTPGSAVITIVDNDRPTVTVAATDGTEAGPTTGNFTFTRTGDTSIALTVNYAVTGTASQADYVQTLSGVITFASGQSNVVAAVTPRLDALLEGNETIIATLTAGQYVIGTPNAATLTIVDNAPTITVAATNGTEAGPTPGNFTFTRTGDTNIALTVNYAVTGTATQADYVETLSGVITFPSGQANVVAVVTPRLDALLEGNETIIATLTAGQYVIGTPGAATLTIVDNAPTITVTATDGTEAGQVPGAFTFTRTGDPNIALTVNYTVTGTATQADYVEAVNGVITFASGQLAVARVVTPRLDALLEGDETIIATLTAGQYVIGSPGAATLTIVDNAPTITVTATDGTEAGQVPGAFTFTRTGDPNIALTVNYTVTGTATQADYVEAVNGVITFASGQLAVARVVTPRLDALLEGDETIIATLTAGQYVIGSPGAATLTIVDNAPTITVTATDGTEAGQAPGAFTFTRTGDPNIALTVNYAVTGTATQADYVETLSGVITFASGQANVVAAVTPRLDALLEGDETVIATLTAGQYVIGASNAATLTVVDNAPTITVTAANGTEAGQAPGAFTFTRTGDTNIALTVNYAVTGTASQADYVQTLSGVITFASGQSNVVAAVTPRLDALLEGDETIIATLTAGQYVIGTPNAATLTIVDNAPTITVAATNGTEAGPTPGNFTFTRTGDPNIALTVNYAVTGTATQADYVETLSGVITFASGQANVVAAVTPRLDALLEGNETIIATLTAGQYVIGTPAAATLTIVDNAPTITVTATNGAEAGQAPGSFTFTRTGDPNVALTVNYVVTGTATQADYVQTLSGTLAFASGQSSVAQVVTPVDDALFEGDETVVVTLGAGQYQTGTPSSATVTIADNDVTTVTITATDADATEIPLANGNTNGGTFTITRTGPTTAGLDVGFTRSGTATSGVDYSGGGNGPGGGSVTIPPGQTSAIVVFLPFNDGLVEGNETVDLTLSPSAGYVIGAPASASIAIVDNVQAITVAATDAAASEAGPNSGTFTITRTGDSSAQVIVNFSLTGSASVGADFGAVNLVAGIPAGELSTTVTIAPVDDALVEGDESVTLTVTAGSYQIGAASNATITISDNDLPTVTIAATDAGASEAGPDPGTFTVTRTGATASPLDVSFGVGGTAANGTDYTPALTGTVTIPVGQVSTVLSLTPVDDPDFEGAETVVVTLAANGAYSIGGTGTATVTLADNDVPTVTVAATDAAASEAGANGGTFTVTRTGSTAASLNVLYTITGTAINGTDYTPTLSGAVTIPAGQVSAQLTLTPVDDAFLEGDETAVLTLAPDAAYSVGAPASATVTIADDEIAPVVTVTAADPTADEQGPSGPTTGLFQFARTGSTASPLTVQYTVTGTAANGVDYVAIPANITFGAGQATVDQTITPIFDGTSGGEAGETVIVTLTDAAAYDVGAAASATVTIIDALTPVVGVSAVDANASESGPDAGTFRISRSVNTFGTFSVQYTVTGTATNGTDYTLLSGTATFPNNQTFIDVTVLPIVDALAEGSETVVLTLLDAADYDLGTVTSDTVTIANFTPPVVNVTPTFNMSESGASQNFTFQRTGSLTAPMTVDFTLSGTATNGVDYALVAGQVTFAAANQFATVTIDPVVDISVEGIETVVVTLVDGVAYDVGTNSSATMTIADALVSIAVTDGTASEDGPDPGTFTISRTGDTTGPLTVGFVASGATRGVDYVDFGTSITIPAGQASADLTVTPILDALTEGAEVVNIFVSAGSYLLGNSFAQLTITDSNAPTVTVTAPDPNAAEPGLNPGTFTITRSGSTTSALTVTLTAGGTAVASSDYLAFTLTPQIPAGQSSVTITVTPINDTQVEGPETVVLTVQDTVAYNLGPAGTETATVTIADQPTPVITIAATDANASEVALDPGTFTITRAGDTAFPLTVTLTRGGTAVVSSDYSAFTLTPQILAGQTSVTLTVTPLTDVLVEGDETVVLTVQDGASYDLGTAGTETATVTIADQTIPVVTIAATDASASEVGLNPGTFTITRTGSTALALSVTLTRQGTAVASNDYAAFNLTPQIPAGQTSVTLTVTPINDALVEGGETVVLTVQDGADYDLGAAGSETATVTIADQPTPVVTIAATDASASEVGADPGTFTITRAGDTAFPLTVNFTRGGTATASSDYSNFSLFVNIGANQTTATITVTPADDALVEGDETAVLTVTDGLQYDLGAAGTETATVTIVDGDVQPVVTIAATDASASEVGANPGTFIITRTGDLQVPLTVNFTRSGTAIASSDYSTFSLFVTIGATQTTATITVTPVDDALVEGDETVVLTLLDGVLYDLGAAGTETAAVTIADGDVQPVVTIAATDAAASEVGANPGTFTITRTGDLQVPLTVNFTRGGTATASSDYSTFNLFVTIGATQTTATITVTPVDDALVEGDETVVLTVTDGLLYDLGPAGTETATVTIADGDVQPVVTIAATDAAASEVGANPGTFTITRTGDLQVPLTVNFTRGGTATASSDYSNFNLFVTIGATQTTATITVTPVDDALVEGDETVVLTVTDGLLYDLGPAGTETATVTIADTPELTITATDPSAAELGPDTAIFTIARNGPTTNARVVRVDLTGTATPGTDYAVSSTAPLANFGPFFDVTIPAGQASATVLVTPIYEVALEPAETVILTGEGSTAQATIADEPAATITVTDATAAELGPDTATFAVTRGGAVGYARVVRVDLTGTATPGTDYAVSSTAPLANFGSFFDVTIPAGQASATVIVTPIYEVALEPAETVILTGEGSTAQATIADEPAATITVTDATAAELGPDTATFAVTRGGAVGYARVVRVDLTGTATPGTDYAVSSTAPLANFGSFFDVTIPAGQTSATVIVTPIYEVALEPAETVILTGEGSTAQATIADEPAATITVTDATAAELGPDTATFAVTRGGAVGYARVVRVDLTGTATPGTDYAVSSTAPLANFGSFFDVTILAGQASAIVLVTPIYEVGLEPAETVILTGEGSTAQATIADEPAATITVTDATAAELGANTATFAVTRGGAVGYARVVRVDLTGTATPGTDYAVSSTAPLSNFGSFFDVTIPAGQMSATVIVTPVADGMFEGQETVTFTAEGSVATAAIADDVVVTIAATDSSATEGGDTAAFAVSRTGSTTQLLDVRVDVTGGSASLGIDYNFLGNASIVSSDSTGFVVRIPAGQASATFTMTAMTDALVEPPETVALTAAGVVATATIVGVTNITMTLSDAAATEGLDTARITLTRSGATTLDQDLRVDIIGGTATLGVDYHFLGNPSIVFSGPTWFVVRIPAGQASVSFTMTGSADVVTETSETAILSAEGMFVTATIFDLITGPLTMGFEEQPDSIPAGTVFPSSYRGMTFTNWLHYAPIPLLTPNGVNALYAAVDGARFTFSQRVFAGASFSRWAGAAPGNVYFELYHQGVLVHTSAILADVAPNLTFLPSGYSGAVDEVRVRFLNGAMVPAGSTLLIDDIMFQ